MFPTRGTKAKPCGSSKAIGELLEDNRDKAEEGEASKAEEGEASKAGKPAEASKRSTSQVNGTSHLFHRENGDNLEGINKCCGTWRNRKNSASRIQVLTWRQKKSKEVKGSRMDAPHEECAEHLHEGPWQMRPSATKFPGCLNKQDCSSLV